MNKTGFLLGKFMPLHNGHVYLVEFAKAYCDHLVILVASMPNEPIPGKLRYEWMKKMFNSESCTVIWTDEILPQEPKDENDHEFWKIWADEIKKAMYAAHRSYWDTPTHVFASEEYGHKLAASVGAEFVPVDMARTMHKISGTKCRRNIFTNWKHLPQVVRSHYSKRITVFGPESTGKSTLIKNLGKSFKDNIVVPEYGRVYTETFGADVDQDDIQKIVQGHQASVNAAKSFGRKLIFEDTDPLMSMVWSDMLTGSHDSWFDNFNDYPDLYLLCKPDIPWVDDGTRYFPDQKDRDRFFNLCKQILDDRKVNYAVIDGLSYHHRWRLAAEHIHSLMKDMKDGTY